MTADKIIGLTQFTFYRLKPELAEREMNFYLLIPGHELKVHFAFEMQNTEAFWLKVTKLTTFNYQRDSETDVLLDCKIDLGEFLPGAGLLQPVRHQKYYGLRMEFISLLLNTVIPDLFLRKSSTDFLDGVDIEEFNFDEMEAIHEKE